MFEMLITAIVLLLIITADASFIVTRVIVHDLKPIHTSIFCLIPDSRPVVKWIEILEESMRHLLLYQELQIKDKMIELMLIVTLCYMEMAKYTTTFSKQRQWHEVDVCFIQYTLNYYVLALL